TDVVGLVLSAVREAARGGQSLVVLTRHGGVGIGGTLTGDAGRSGSPRSMHAVDVGPVPRCANVGVCAPVSEHGAYAFAGRVEGYSVRAVHTADPLLADLLIQRLGQAAGARLGD